MKSQSIYSYKNNFLFSNVKHERIKDSFLSKPPIFTIAIPTFMRVSTLKDTIDSTLNQNGFDDYEVLVVDNNPERNDETELFISKNYSGEKKLVYCKNSENIGMTGNWNRLYEISRSEWVIMLHDDDLLFPDALKVIAEIIKHERDKLDVLFLSVTSDANYKYKPEQIKKYVRLYPFDYMMANYGHVVGTVIRRSVVLDIGGFDNSFYPSADYHFWAKLSLFYRVYRVIGRPLAYYRILENESQKTKTLEGFLEKDIVIKQGILSYLSPSKFKQRIYSYYVRQSALSYFSIWKRYFGSSDQQKDFDTLFVRYEQNTGFMSKVIYIFYHQTYIIYKKFRNRCLSHFVVIH